MLWWWRLVLWYLSPGRNLLGYMVRWHGWVICSCVLWPRVDGVGDECYSLTYCWLGASIILSSSVGTAICGMTIHMKWNNDLWVLDNGQELYCGLCVILGLYSPVGSSMSRWWLRRWDLLSAESMWSAPLLYYSSWFVPVVSCEYVCPLTWLSTFINQS